jgi:drug/metabolite transporter (DMT)-like permease
MNILNKDMSNRSKGIFFIIISALGFALMSTFVKLSGNLPIFQKTFFRNLISFLFAFAMVYKHKDRFLGKKENRKLLLLRATTGTLGILCNFYAIGKLVLSDANMLNQLSSFFAIILAAIFLKEKVKLNQVVSIVIAFIGALFIIKPQFNFDVIPALVGIFGAIFAASSYTCLRDLGKKEQGPTVVFVFSLFTLIVLFPMMMVTYKHMTLLQLSYLLLSGVFATIGQFGITFAYKYAPAKEISIFNYTNVIFSAVISVLLFNVIPDEFSIIGYIIIFSSAIYMFMYNKKLDKKDI